MVFLLGRGSNLPTIPSSGGIKGVGSDNAPAHQMLRDDPRQGHQILAKPLVTPPSPPACRGELEERWGQGFVLQIRLEGPDMFLQVCMLGKTIVLHATREPLLNEGLKKTTWT